MIFMIFEVVGLIAGYLAGQAMKGGGYGTLADMLLGVLGGIVGRWAFGLTGLHTGGFIGSIVVSIVAAVVFVWLTRLVKKDD
jgi:uncharacterized membrane protein YeaQ/YmgE (transglycosylase-associated protein family)